MRKEESPQARGGVFSEVAAWARELVKQGKMTPDQAQLLTDEIYRNEMVFQVLGYPIAGDRPEELPEHLAEFPGALNSDGSVNFSNQ